jgi:cyclophilin family peptidyl-prolyl cis-trans isomerase
MKIRPFAAVLALFASFSAFAANPQVEMKTNKGTIVLELYPDKAPKTVANFLQYVKDGFYGGTVFHRVIPGFMIQGGGFDKNMKQKATRPSIVNESNNGLKNDTGTIAMARTSDPNSASAQFFINLVDNAGLNYPANDGYAVFGKVVKGNDVVQGIAKVSTGMFPTAMMTFENVPDAPIVIESAKILTPNK